MPRSAALNGNAEEEEIKELGRGHHQNTRGVGGSLAKSLIKGGGDERTGFD